MNKLLTLAIILCLNALCFGRWSGGDVYLWRDFKTTYNRRYLNKTEESARFQCFVKNLQRIEELNAAEPDGAIHSINSFADMCAHEFKSTYHGLKVNRNRKRNFAELFQSHVVDKSVQSGIDWRVKGAVTQVKNQGSCGSCWAFSSTGNIEGLNFIKTGNLVSLSEEELVECSRPDGCSGGIMDEAFEWVKENGGITTEDDYPYTSGSGVTGQCRQSKLTDSAVRVRGFVDIPADEDQMATWVAHNGPLSIAVDASQGWQLYGGGIKKSCNDSGLDHGVLIVGYGTTTAGTKYWIVKNSWGAGWGEGGYIRLQRGVNCNGIADHAVSAK